MRPGAQILTESLSKVYEDSRRGKICAATDISIACYPGEVFGLLGTNGAGKTTTLRMLSTVLQPTGGRAWVAGFEITQNPQAIRERIGFLSSDTGVYGRLTAQEMMRYFGQLYGMPSDAIERRIEEICTRLDMGGFLDSRCDRLSSGQRQKVSIGRTIIHDPPVLILDEPTAGLDVLGAAEIIRFIREARSENRCILLSTHIMREAEKLCDQIAILHEGRVQACGTLDELSAHMQTADLEEIFLSVVGASV
ncbi:MAG: ATP-binding cassette domain-containing protein [bacterium]